jgi:hypothetical protein
MQMNTKITASRLVLANAILMAIQPPVYAGFTANTASGAPNGVANGFIRTQDSKMVCGDMAAANGYAFTRQQLGASDTLGVVKYQTGTNVTSSMPSGPNHVLQRQMMNFTVIGADPYANTDIGEKNITYIFGGGRGTSSVSYSNAYYRYNSAGFQDGNGDPISNTNTLMGNGLITPRAAMSAANLGHNKILIFGGFDSQGTRTDAFIFNRLSKQWTSISPTPFALQDAKLLSAGGPSTFPSLTLLGPAAVSWVYAVGGSGDPAQPSANRKIFRYDINADKWIVVQDANGVDIQVPGTYPVEIASVQGAMLIITQGEDGSSMVVYKLTHPSGAIVYGSPPGALGTGKGATLTATNYPDGAQPRARDGFALLRCSADTWVIGGAYGHGPSFSDRGRYVEKLTR